MTNNQPLDYLQSALKEFRYYKSLADQTMARLSPEQMLWRPNAQSNSIATIVKHMTGNMLSRFTNFLTEDGEKSWRNRDEEFDATDILNKERSSGDRALQMSEQQKRLDAWNKAWDIVFETLHSLGAEDLQKTVYIRTEPHSVVQAINRQVAHYAYHVGQIVFIGKCLVENWASLSIPLNGSRQYNEAKSAK